MIRNDQIQAGWVAEIKSRTSITNLVPSVEIREDSWKGTDFSYPCIRVKMTSLRPKVPSERCILFYSDVTILVFGEQKSSLSIDQIAGTVGDEFWGANFTSNGIKFIKVSLAEIIPAHVPEDDPDAWVSEVNLQCLIQSA